MKTLRYGVADPAADTSAAPEPCELETFRLPLRLFAARRLRNWTMAEDVSQEVLRVGLEALNAGRVASRELLPGFLFKTAVHVCMHRSRSAAREKRALERFGVGLYESGPADALENALTGERRSRLRAAMAELSPDERRILELTYDQELDSDDIARQLGLRAGAVRVRRHRAIRRLSEILGVTPSCDRESRG